MSMKVLCIYAFLAIAIPSAVQAEAVSAPESSSWYYPFWRRGCKGCTAKGNALPWCVRVPVQNLICTSLEPVKLPACFQVPGSQVVGAVASAEVAGLANGLSESATVSASQLTCSADNTISPDCMESITTTVFPEGALPSSVSVEANQVSGTFLDTAFIAGSQITGEITIATIDGAQITGEITIATIDGAQITGEITNATIDGAQITGSINGSQINTPVSLANNLQCPANATANSLILPSCYAINASAGQIIGNIPGGQITGVINATGVTFNGQLGASACSGCLATMQFSNVLLRNSSCDTSSVSQTLVAVCPSGTSFASKPTSSICPTSQNINMACQSSDPAVVTFNATTWQCTYTCEGSTIGVCGSAEPFTAPVPFACV